MTAETTDKTKKYKYLVSVIIPVYNVAAYLDDSIASVIGQTIGFRDNIQLILVNDGSTDGSSAVCCKYRDLYPDNVVFIDKENGGVSSARNAGMEFMQGKYVNFLDSDDIWKEDAFEQFMKFFDANPDVRIATARMVFFGAKSGASHHLDYKYKKTKVIDIDGKYYDYPEFSVAKTFFRSEAIDGNRFDESVAFSEDVLFLTEIILDEKRFGVIREAEYMYRRRLEETSLLGTSRKSPEYFTVTPDKVYNRLIEITRAKAGEVIPYVQYLLITDLQWRLDVSDIDVLSEEEFSEYRSTMIDILQVIDDSVIAAQRRMDTGYKAYVMGLKHGGIDKIPASKLKILSKYVRLNAIVFNAYDENGVYDTKDDSRNSLYISGMAEEKQLGENYSVYAEDEQGRRYDMEYARYEDFDRTGIDPEIVIPGEVHSISLPLRDGATYSFYITDGGSLKRKITLKPRDLSRLDNTAGSFFMAGKHIIEYNKQEIHISRSHIISGRTMQNRYNKRIENLAGKRVSEIRHEAISLKKNSKRPILVCINNSDDGSTAVYDYLMDTMATYKYDIYYVGVGVNAEDTEDITITRDLARIGTPLEYGSAEHIARQIAASVIVVYRPDEKSMNPYKGDFKYYRDLMDQQLVFLTEATDRKGKKWEFPYNRKLIRK